VRGRRGFGERGWKGGRGGGRRATHERPGPSAEGAQQCLPGQSRGQGFPPSPLPAPTIDSLGPPAAPHGESGSARGPSGPGGRQLFVCRFCNRQFSCGRALGGHMKMHKGESPGCLGPKRGASGSRSLGLPGSLSPDLGGERGAYGSKELGECGGTIRGRAMTRGRRRRERRGRTPLWVAGGAVSSSLRSRGGRIG